MKGQGDPDSGSTGLVIAVGTILVVVSVLGVIAYFRSYTEQFHAERVTRRDSPALTEMLSLQRERLAGYGLSADEPRVAHIPIDVAMDMMVQQADDNASR